MNAISEKYIFDVPIYWCNEKSFWHNYDAKLAEHLAAFEGQTGYQLTDSLRDSLTDSFWRRYIAPWRFNQIVGWVRIYRMGNQLRGELWYMNAKRAGRQLTKKQFSDQGKAFEMSVGRDETSRQIYENLRCELARIEGWKGRKMILDLETFDNIGPNVDWRTLFNKEHDV